MTNAKCVSENKINEMSFIIELDLWLFHAALALFDCISVVFIAQLPLCRLPCDLQSQGRRANQQIFIARLHCRNIQIFLISHILCDPNWLRKEIKSPINVRLL